jgi:hypothetical protein
MEEAFIRTINFTEGTSGAQAFVRVRAGKNWASIRLFHRGEGELEVVLSGKELDVVIAVCQEALRVVS